MAAKINPKMCGKDVALNDFDRVRIIWPERVRRKQEDSMRSTLIRQLRLESREESFEVKSQ